MPITTFQKGLRTSVSDIPIGTIFFMLLCDISSACFTTLDLDKSNPFWTKPYLERLVITITLRE